MRKLEDRNTCTSADIPNCSNCGLALNSSEGKNSVSGLKTSSNSSDAVLTGQRITRKVPVGSCCRSLPLLIKENDCQLSLKTGIFIFGSPSTPEAVDFRAWKLI